MTETRMFAYVLILPETRERGDRRDVPRFLKPGNVVPGTSFLGIDIGTSFIKTGVLDLDGLRVAGIARMAFPEPLRGLPPLHREYDPIEIVEVARRLIARTPRVGGIVFCGQMHGLVLLDAGVDIIKVKDLLGHRHVTTTQIYDKRRRTTKESASHDVPI